jgi:hypothetical protein
MCLRHLTYGTRAIVGNLAMYVYTRIRTIEKLGSCPGVSEAILRKYELSLLPVAAARTGLGHIK